MLALLATILIIQSPLMLPVLYVEITVLPVKVPHPAYPAIMVHFYQVGFVDPAVHLIPILIATIIPALVVCLHARHALPLLPASHAAVDIYKEQPALSNAIHLPTSVHLSNVQSVCHHVLLVAQPHPVSLANYLISCSTQLALLYRPAIHKLDIIQFTLPTALLLLLLPVLSVLFLVWVAITIQ